jgi:isoamylase
LIIDSLRYWVSEMHVDGFRFDLASILSRDQDGRPMASPPILWDIESDPILANVKLIAESWDAAGLYQVGRFVGDSWKEWNGRFRDDVRAFLKGDNGMAAAMAFRLTGSPDVYQREEREAEQSINFVTCHDGFTLNDLVSFNSKHNEVNGEENRDGADYNASWNCGVEGPTADTEVERLRNRQIKNFFTLTLLATGTPMLLMGDEVRRTQGGNNNAFCQNNEISWFDWNLVEKHADIRRFVQELIALRMNRDLPVERLDMTLNELLRQQPVRWHGVKLDAPDWGRESHTLAATVRLFGYPLLLHFIVNAYWEALEFEVPALDQAQEAWRRCGYFSRSTGRHLRLGRCSEAAGIDLPGSAALCSPPSCQSLRRAEWWASLIRRHFRALGDQVRADAVGFGFQIFGGAQTCLPDRRVAGAFREFPVPRRQLP